MDIRTGLGWDNHRIASGRLSSLVAFTSPQRLAWKAIPMPTFWHMRSLMRFSGAAALGDIGMHFPDTDPRWKDADSLQFLRHACDLIRGGNYRISNVDSTVILERPKLKDYRTAIREQLASTIGLPLERISVKFKTSEKVGPVAKGVRPRPRL